MLAKINPDKIIGVDIAEKMLEIGNKKINDISFFSLHNHFTDIGLVNIAKIPHSVFMIMMNPIFII